MIQLETVQRLRQELGLGGRAITAVKETVAEGVELWVTKGGKRCLLNFLRILQVGEDGSHHGGKQGNGGRIHGEDSVRTLTPNSGSAQQVLCCVGSLKVVSHEIERKHGFDTCEKWGCEGWEVILDFDE